MITCGALRRTKSPSIFLEKQAVKCVVDFKKGKMLEVLRYALPYAPCTMRFALLSAVPDPSSIPVAGCPD